MTTDIASLRAAYLDGVRTPTHEMQRLLDRAADPTWGAVWIHRVDSDVVLRRARHLELQAQQDAGAIERLPLWGIPYAVKDNIDVKHLPTTAACPSFAYSATRSATVVERLEAAGAILIGKTNLDQFATGLSGTRSPYGVVRNAINPRYVSGGSSSGSAVAVARGMVSFALGTDTAGSGRVPAGLNNIVGLKPSRGLVSAQGVVPACRSLDCVSVFGLTVPDAAAVSHVLRGVDPDDPYSRNLALTPDACPARFRFAVPDEDTLEFFGDEQSRQAFSETLALLRRIGGDPVEVDFTPFTEAAALLYDGPWVAERLAAIRPFFDRHAAEMHPVVRDIIGGGTKWSAADLFVAIDRLEVLKRRTLPLWERVNVLVVPTAPTVYTIEQMLADPVALNRNLGTYTNFVNLLDLAALSVPAGVRADGMPAGVTLIHRAGSDLMLADLGQRLQWQARRPMGGMGWPLPPPEACVRAGDMVEVAVVGAHLSGQPLNYQLVERSALLMRTCKTTPRYRLFALPSSSPPKPGLLRTTDAPGQAIELEVWRVPTAAYGSLVGMIPSPLGIGRIELEDGSWVQGFLCEAWAVKGAEEISRFGGWRAWLAHRAAVA